MEAQIEKLMRTCATLAQQRNNAMDQVVALSVELSLVTDRLSVAEKELAALKPQPDSGGGPGEEK